MKKTQILFEAQKQLAVCKIQSIEAHAARQDGTLSAEGFKQDLNYIQGKQTAISAMVNAILPEAFFNELHNDTIIDKIVEMIGFNIGGIHLLTLDVFAKKVKEAANAKKLYYYHA